MVDVTPENEEEGFNPLSCGAFTATSLRKKLNWNLIPLLFQSPFMRGLHCDSKLMKCMKIKDQEFQSPFMRGLHCDGPVITAGLLAHIDVVSIPFHAGPSLRPGLKAIIAQHRDKGGFQSPFMRGLHCDAGDGEADGDRSLRRFNPLSCGAFTATRRPPSRAARSLF